MPEALRVYDKGTNMEYEGRKYEYSVVPYASGWAEVYKREAALIQRILGEDLIYIEHIGGTAVAGTCGRPIVDIAVAVRDLARVDFYHMALAAVGYEPVRDITFPHARRFVKDTAADLYIFPGEHPMMAAMADHRDYLRAHPDEAKKLSELKNKLFKKYGCDFAAYQEDKEEFLKRLSRKAAHWRGRAAESDEGTV